MGATQVSPLTLKNNLKVLASVRAKTSSFASSWRTQAW
jgi:hypothetical protein